MSQKSRNRKPSVAVAVVVSPDQARKDAAKQRRIAKREAYPVIVVNLKLHKAAQSRDVLAKMFATAQEWANGNKYVVTTGDTKTQKSGAEVHALTIDTPESYAAKLKTSDSGTAQAFAAALRNPEVQSAAAKRGIAPKELVLEAMRKQFGITIEL